MKKIVFFFLISFSFSGFAQQSESIVGNWFYKDIYEKENQDSTSLKMIEMFFSDMNFNFMDDKTYHLEVMRKEEDGKWNLTEDSKTIEFTSNEGEENSMEIIKLSEKELIIKMKKATFILYKKELE